MSTREQVIEWAKAEGLVHNSTLDEIRSQFCDGVDVSDLTSLYEIAFQAGREQGLGEGRGDQQEWRSAMYALVGQASSDRLDGKTDMPSFYLKLAGMIAAAHVDDDAVRAIEALRGGGG